MTTKPDLAALARDLCEEAETWERLGGKRATQLLRRAADALSEPAVEADAELLDMLAAAEQREIAALRVATALRAQLEATKEEGASWRRVAEGLQSQLAAAAPLFEAAHRHNDDEDIDESLWDAVDRWARSEDGQWRKRENQ